MIRPRFLSRSSISGQETKMSMHVPRKVRAVFSLVALTLVICTFFDDESVQIIQNRYLMQRCKTIPELVAELNEGEVRRLHRAPFESKTLYERLLELGAEDPCITEFPPEIHEVIADNETAKEMTEPTFDVAADDDQFLAQEVDGIVDIAPQNKNFTLDTSELNFVSNFPPENYHVGGTVDGPLERDDGYNTIAYTIALTGCPEWYEPGVDTNGEPPLPPDLYEASAILKSEVCETALDAASRRRLGLTRKLSALEDRTSAAEMGYSMHSLIHPMTTDCPVEGGGIGETYGRVSLLSSLGYEVDIVGHPINERDLADAQQFFILDNIEADVGVRDSTKLHIWRMTSYPAVVLMTYKTLLQQPLDEEIDVLLADGNMKGMYILNAPDPETGGAGVDTGLLIIKPDLDEFDRIVSAYINTPYLEGSGWNGLGYNNFKGHLGISGFLAYYFANNPGYQQLDRCRYAHGADDLCIQQQSMADSKAFKMVDEICGNPRDCPYDHPNWSEEKKAACSTIHRKYYDYRYQFEEKYFNKSIKQDRIGLFKPESFLGYCTGAGSEHHLSLVGEVILTPNWQTTCPPYACPEGSFMKPDCSCTAVGEDPCSACPVHTYCQTSPSLMCIDRSCGFCDPSGAACCDLYNPGNSDYCSLQSNFFPAFPGSGSACEVESYQHATIPNGCGCNPNTLTPCTYNTEWSSAEEKCFICTAIDFANEGRCNSCLECIRSCTAIPDCFDSAGLEVEYMTCLSEPMDAGCRASCQNVCTKSSVLDFGNDSGRSSSPINTNYSSTKAPRYYQSYETQAPNQGYAPYETQAPRYYPPYEQT